MFSLIQNETFLNNPFGDYDLLYFFADPENIKVQQDLKNEDAVLVDEKIAYLNTTEVQNKYLIHSCIHHSSHAHEDEQ